jgi:protein-S-isoprenylcysteine O-methyltransferase Ste14
MRRRGSARLPRGAVAEGCRQGQRWRASRWTHKRRHLRARVAAQVAIFGGLSLWLLPSAVLDLTGRDWRPALEAPGWLLGLALQLLAVPALVGAAAVIELAERGGGTPFPWDPPERLVVTGPYAYVANPMQLAMTLLMVGLGVLLASPAVALAGIVAGAFGAGFAGWQEAGDMAERFGPAWRAYARAVRPWRPTWRPAGARARDALLRRELPGVLAGRGLARAPRPGRPSAAPGRGLSRAVAAPDHLRRGRRLDLRRRRRAGPRARAPRPGLGPDRLGAAHARRLPGRPAARRRAGRRAARDPDQGELARISHGVA